MSLTRFPVGVDKSLRPYIGTRILCEDFGAEGASGGVDSGYTYAYDEDESWTHDRYFAAIAPFLGSGEAK